MNVFPQPEWPDADSERSEPGDSHSQAEAEHGDADSRRRCAICGRVEKLTRHHLIPRTRHHNKRNKREFDRDVVKQVVGICRPCHSQIHAVLSEKELEREWNTVERLRAHPEIAKFAAWIASKPAGFRVPTREAKR